MKWNGIQTGVLHHRHHFDAVNTPISPYAIPGDLTVDEMYLQQDPA